MWGEVMSPLAVERYYELIGARLPNEESRIRDFLRMHFVERAAFDPALFYVRRLGAVVLARSLRDFPDVEHHPIRVMRLRGGPITDMSFRPHLLQGIRVVVLGRRRADRTLLPTGETFRDGLRRGHRDSLDVAIREIVSNPGIPEISVDRFVDEVCERNESLGEALRTAHLREALQRHRPCAGGHPPRSGRRPSSRTPPPSSLRSRSNPA